jgi:hypothetical protein
MQTGGIVAIKRILVEDTNVEDEIMVSIDEKRIQDPLKGDTHSFLYDSISKK